ncbi:hypothetical protein XENOCAPTIV_018756 [Xenoophorus captivus]|uniref:Uncharacterized protein n=1 Tax=Xenoophorus captivus TaxID=1517983 RepID=A0ABV0RZL9_9TELE
MTIPDPILPHPWPYTPSLSSSANMASGPLTRLGTHPPPSTQAATLPGARAGPTLPRDPALNLPTLARCGSSLTRRHIGPQVTPIECRSVQQQVSENDHRTN